MMSCISYISSATVVSRSSHVVMRSSLYGFSSNSWKQGIYHAGMRAIKLDFLFSRYRVQCNSARCARGSQRPKINPETSMEEESKPYYVVRKGDVIGIYKNLSDCQAQVSSSVCDPPVSVYKGYSLHKETEQFLGSRGLTNALYTIHASHVKEDLFGTLVPCPFNQPDGLGFFIDKTYEKAPSKRPVEAASTVGATGSSTVSTEVLQKRPKLGLAIEAQPLHSKKMSCTIEFDGASKGNPGKAGAGAILRAEDGSIVSRLRQGLGVVTNNVAEYRALILGMQYAHKKGFKEIKVQGDSKLVCMQVQGLWQTKNQNMADLCKVVKELKDMFVSVQINHVKRDLNSDADGEANLAVDLPNGEVYEECGQL